MFAIDANESAARDVAMLRSAPQARFWEKVRNVRVAQDSTGRMAKIRLRREETGKIRRKHGCNGSPLRFNTAIGNVTDVRGQLQFSFI
jgi:hypothetical protein